MSGHTEADPRVLRSALGSFPTGVTVITACSPEGELVGITANSFNSVSLEPPLVLWSLDKDALSRSAFEDAGFFAVNVLGAHQAELSARFASRGADKFGSLEVGSGAGGSPLLDGCTAQFQCVTERTIDAGDHLIFIGRVLQFDHDPTVPALAYHRGRYCEVAPHGSDP